MMDQWFQKSKLALLLDEGLKSKYVIGSDENQMRRKETSSISSEDYQSRVSKLMSVVILRNKTPEWLWFGVEHISKKIPDEDRSLIKKGWDQMYRVPIV